MLAQLLTTVLGFFLLVAVLRKFFWHTVLQLLDDRRRRIEEGLRDVARSKDELERMKADYAGRIHAIEDEARVKIQQAILEGKRISTEIQEEARAQSYVLVNKAKDTIDLELAKANVTLRDQLAAMTLQAVERILREKLDAEQDRRLVTDVLEQLEQEGR